jgi:DNA-binding response OmpR family regulator
MLLSMTNISAPQTVLVADDDPSIHAIFRRLVKPMGVRLISCLDGESVEARVHEDPPDLVFLDVFMPGRDGIDVCRQLRKNPPTSLVPILMLSARGELDDRLKGLEAGANDYLVKPVELAEVVAKVRTYLELSRLQKKLIESERRRAVTGLLRGLAHQFNNILCGISGTAQVMDLRVAADHPVKEHCRTIVQYSHRAATISQQLLVLAGARRDSGDSSVTDILESCKSAWDASMSGTSRNHKLETKCTIPSGVRLRMGSADMQSALFHLMQNAVRAMTEGGTIHLDMWLEDHSAFIEISDTGKGMTSEEQAKAMEPFYQNWDRPSDAGLGLPFVRALAEEVGGSLDLDSITGQGTRVRLSVPAG